MTIDLHAHILPGIDDGSQSLEMAGIAAAGGVRHMAAIPHCNLPDNPYDNYDSPSLTTAAYGRLTFWRRR